MDVNVDTLLVDFDGNSIPTDPDDETSPPFTLGRVCESALMTPMPGDNNTLDPVLERHDLAERIHKGGTITVTAEQVAQIKKRLPGRFGPVIVGPACRLLEGQPQRYPDGD